MPIHDSELQNSSVSLSTSLFVKDNQIFLLKQNPGING